jgi:hypothetical protein
VAGSAAADGVVLRVFTYCVPRTLLRRLLWEAGLPPGCLEFSETVEGSDFVLHLKPAPGERQYAYDEVGAVYDRSYILELKAAKEATRMAMAVALRPGAVGRQNAPVKRMG